MKRKSAYIAATVFGAFVAIAVPASAMTKKECIDAGGTWTQRLGHHGTCSQTLSLANKPKNIEVPLTAEECRKQGGEVSADGKNCITPTKNITKTKDIKQTN